MSWRERDATIQELLDEATFDDAALELNLRDIRHINTLLGWTAFTTRAVAQVVREQRLTQFSLLDVASGSADMPLAIARWSRRAQVPARIVASDISPQIVRIAKAQSTAYPEIAVERQNAFALTYPDQSFTIGLCTLALHHFAPTDAARALRELGRVAQTVLLFDVERSPLAYWGAYALTRGAGMHPMTRHDAPASVRRAYSAAELRDLAHQAGLTDADVRVLFPFRLALKAISAA